MAFPMEEIAMKKFLLPLFVFTALSIAGFSPASGAEVNRHTGVPEKCLKEENYPQLSEAETRFCRDVVSSGLFKNFEEMQVAIEKAKKQMDQLVRDLEAQKKKNNEGK